MLAACLPQGVNPTLPARARHAVPSAASALGLMEQRNSICYPGYPTCSARAVLELEESPDREPGVSFIPQSSSNSYTHVWAGMDRRVLPPCQHLWGCWGRKRVCNAGVSLQEGLNTGQHVRWLWVSRGM